MSLFNFIKYSHAGRKTKAITNFSSGSLLVLWPCLTEGFVICWYDNLEKAWALCFRWTCLSLYGSTVLYPARLLAGLMEGKTEMQCLSHSPDWPNDFTAKLSQFCYFSSPSKAWKQIGCFVMTEDVDKQLNNANDFSQVTEQCTRFFPRNWALGR